MVLFIASLNRRFRPDVVWSLFLVGLVLALPLAFWLIPKLFRGALKHVLRAVVVAVLLGPIVGPPDTNWLPSWPIVLGAPGFFVSSGLGIQPVLGSYLLLLATLCASLGWDFWRMSKTVQRTGASRSASETD
jgi:hypothetical protein